MEEKQPLNIVIPMAGHGTRFVTAGYQQPKPLISILGRPMLIHLLDNLQLSSNDRIYIGLQKSSNKTHNVMSKLRAHLPTLPLYEILISRATSGAADTLKCILEHIPHERAQRRVVSLDCDTLYYFDVLAAFRRLPLRAGGVTFFKDTGSKPMFSYICLDEENRVTDIREKDPVSENANTGAYGFADVVMLQKYLSKLLEMHSPERGEFYTSSVIEMMVKDGLEFFGIEAEEFACVGTPEQLLSFIDFLKRNKQFVTSEPLVFSVSQSSESKESVSNGLLKPTFLSEDHVQVLKGLKGMGFRVLLAAKAKEYRCLNEEKFEVASFTEKKRAEELGCFFMIDSNLRKSVGW